MSHETTIRSGSVEYLFVRKVRAFDVTSADAANPTALPVWLALVPAGAPAAGDWRAAEWVGTEDVRLLLDPAAMGYAAGSYTVWLRIDGAIEAPRRPVGTVKVA